MDDPEQQPAEQDRGPLFFQWLGATAVLMAVLYWKSLWRPHYPVHRWWAILLVSALLAAVALAVDGWRVRRRRR